VPIDVQRIVGGDDFAVAIIQRVHHRHCDGNTARAVIEARHHRCSDAITHDTAVTVATIATVAVRYLATPAPKKTRGSAADLRQRRPAREDAVDDVEAATRSRSTRAPRQWDGGQWGLATTAARLG
jgi:hypothetical protein